METKEKTLQVIAKYCYQNIPDYDLKAESALRAIGRRMPIDTDFRNEIEDCASEWADENEYSIDFIEGIDAEEIVLCPIDEDDTSMTTSKAL